MRHGKKLKKLNRTAAHRKSLLMNLAISLFKHERIKTTLAKAKVLRPFAEKLITKSRNNNLHTIRQLASVISDKSIVKKLVGEIGERFKTRPGGYTRIYKCGFRTDSAPVALIELVDYSARLKEKESKTVGEKIVQGTTSAKEKLISLVKSDKPQEDKKTESDKKEETKKEESKPSIKTSKVSKTNRSEKKVASKKDSNTKKSK